MNTVTIREGDQFIGQFTIKDETANEFVRRVLQALENGEARDTDEDGCEVTATEDHLWAPGIEA